VLVLALIASLVLREVRLRGQAQTQEDAAPVAAA
jgi:hypothetical protein